MDCSPGSKQSLDLGSLQLHRISETAKAVERKPVTHENNLLSLAARSVLDWCIWTLTPVFFWKVHKKERPPCLLTPNRHLAQSRHSGICWMNVNAAWGGAVVINFPYLLSGEHGVTGLCQPSKQSTYIKSTEYFLPHNLLLWPVKLNK